MTAKTFSKSKMALMSALAATAVAFAAPAAAQSYARMDDGQQINAREGQLVARLSQVNQTGELTNQEIAALRRQVADFRSMEQRYRANGLSRWEVSELNRLLDGIHYNLNRQRSDRDRERGANDRRDRDGRYDRDYRYGDRNNSYGYGRR